MTAKQLDAAALAAFLEGWLEAWNRHDLEGVLAPLADEVVFEHWNGRVVRGRAALAKAWGPWFEQHGGFRFERTSLCADSLRQSLSFEWSLDWPVPTGDSPDQRELRHGIDHLEFREGLIVAKRSYIRTVTRFEQNDRLSTSQV